MREFLTRSGIGLLHISGAHRLLASFRSGRGAVLRLDRVRPDPPADFAPNSDLEITPEFLSALVGRVRALGLDVVDLQEAKRRLSDPTAGRFVVLTFDHGYRDRVRHVWPVLKELRAPFTVFVATGFVDRTAEPWWLTLEEVVARQELVAVNRAGTTEYFGARTLRAKRATFRVLRDWLATLEPDRLHAVMRELAWRYRVDGAAIADAEMMDWSELKALAADPLVTIGVQTVGHVGLARLTATEARAEIANSAKVLEAAIGERPRHFAYPYGEAGEREFRMAADLGFETAVTTRRGLLRAADAERPTVWPRISVSGRHQSLRSIDAMLAGVAFARDVRAAAST